MDRDTVQRHIACVLVKYNWPVEVSLQELRQLETDKAESGKVGMIGYSKNGKRVATRVGRFIKSHFGEHMGDQTVQDIGSAITALLWSNDSYSEDSDEGVVKELEGEDLRHFYLESVSGIGSCMAYEETQPYLDIYVDNPDVVKLAAVRLGGYSARALIWTFPNGERYMDRIYHRSDACKAALIQYADKHGIWQRSEFPSIVVQMKIRNGENSYWPYVDTMHYMTIIDEHTCELSAYDGNYVLQFTNGTFEEGYRCEDCGNYLGHDADVYSGPDGNDYCEECYYERFFCCDSCGQMHYNDDRIDTATGVCICESCFDRYYFRCENCGEVFNSNQAYVVSNGECVCDDCFEDHYFVCEECNEIWHTQDQHEDPNGDPICPDCAEQYAKCPECDEIVGKDTLVDGMRPDCAADKMVEAADE